jgi:hypothetical protein
MYYIGSVVRRLLLEVVLWISVIDRFIEISAKDIGSVFFGPRSEFWNWWL